MVLRQYEQTSSIASPRRTDIVGRTGPGAPRTKSAGSGVTPRPGGPRQPGRRRRAQGARAPRERRACRRIAAREVFDYLVGVRRTLRAVPTLLRVGLAE